MPALPPAPNIIKALCKQETEAGNLFNILYFHNSGSAPTPATLVTVANDIMAAWSAHLSAYQSNDLTFEGVECIDLTSDVSAVGSSSSAPFAGGASSAILSINAAACISHTISRRYRGGHPRSYFGGITQGELANPSTWTGAFTAALETAWTAFINAVVGISVGGLVLDEWVNLSYYTGGELRTAPVWDIITGSVVKPRVCSQRRRLGKVGG